MGAAARKKRAAEHGGLSQVKISLTARCIEQMAMLRRKGL
jgi:hypothetical protein